MFSVFLHALCVHFSFATVSGIIFFLFFSLTIVHIDPDDCKDKEDANCDERADEGKCLKDFNGMVKDCPWSCRFCAREGGRLFWQDKRVVQAASPSTVNFIIFQ